MAKKKAPQQLKFKDLLHEAGIEIGLTKVEEKQIISRHGNSIYPDIKSMLAKYRSELPKKVILTDKTIIVPAFEAGSYDPLKSDYFRSKEIFSFFSSKYPATQKTTLTETFLSGEVHGSVIGESIGEKLYSHALTPLQADNVINQIGNELLNQTKEIEAKLILFLKGNRERKELRQENSSHDGVILISTTIRTLRLTPERKEFICHPALIGVVDSNNVTNGSFWLDSIWGYKYLLNKEIHKSTIPLNF